MTEAIQLIKDMAALLEKRPETIMMDVQYQDDMIALEIEILSNYEWMALDHAVPMPERIKMGMSASGVQYDYNHPDYQRALRERTTKIALKRMARCIKASIPGEDNDAQADWLHKNYPVGFLSAISAKLVDLHTEGTADIRRGSFRPE
jgi:hypothetical protein